MRSEIEAYRIAEIVRENLRRSIYDPCACFRTGGVMRGKRCNGVCEDAVEKVSEAIVSALKEMPDAK